MDENSIKKGLLKLETKAQLRERCFKKVKLKISELGLKPETEALLEDARFDTVEQLLWILAENPKIGFLAIEGMSEDTVNELESALRAAKVKIRITAPESLICEIVAENARTDALYYFLHESMSEAEQSRMDQFVLKAIADNTVRQAVRMYYGVKVGSRPKSYAEIGKIFKEVCGFLPKGSVADGIEILRRKDYAAAYTKRIQQELR
jgi:hypothetical protein